MNQPQLIVIDTPEEVLTLYQYLQDKEFVVYDSETTGLTKYHEIIGFSVCAEEGKAFYVIMGRWSTEQNKIIYGSKELSYAVYKVIEELKNKKLIMHNAVFDCYMADSYFKVSLMPSLHTDTMILAHLLNENRRVGLKELSSELFGESATTEQQEMKESVLKNGGKLTKDHYEMYKADPYLLGKYGAKDALLTYKLFTHLVPELYEQKLDKFFYEDESMPLLRGPTYELNSTGLQIDLKKLAALKKQLEVECLEAKAFIYQEINSYVKEKYPATNSKNTFNIGSSSQLSWLIFGRMKLEFNTLTKEGKTVCKALNLKLPYTYKAKRDFIELCIQAKDQVYQSEVKTFTGTKRAKKIKDPWSYIACDKLSLKKHSAKHKWIERLLEYQRKMKILNTYITGLEEGAKYGIIQPQFLQHGTTSGRYSSRNPNFQNLPRDDKRIKECVISRPGQVFVGADFSQLEPRIFSYYSGDTRLMAAFDGKKDFYSVVGMDTFNKTDCVPQKEGPPNAFGIKYKSLRDRAKTIALARAYGATAPQLAKTTGKSIEETQQDIDNYDEAFPGVLKMMRDAHSLAKKYGYVTNLYGRPRRIPEAPRITKLYGDIPHEDLPYEARSLLNLACNHRIQSTGASIVNRAVIRYKANSEIAGINSKVVLQVHDSLVIECSEADAENVALLLQDAMENTNTLPGVSLEAIPKIGKNLAEV